MSKAVFDLINKEEVRQASTISLIPSENYISPLVREALGSVLSNKYAEGYVGRRYYEGNAVVDQIEQHAIDLAKTLFGVPHVNVQPYSGSPANSAILFALCEMHDTIMGLSLSSGGHLTHGHPNITFSGKYFRSEQFELGDDFRIDYDALLEKAHVVKPKVIIIGTTAYPFILDFKRCRAIADEVGAYLVADISHIAGLVVAGQHPSPVSYAHVIMTTTHKTLRGPRGGMIMVTESGLNKDPKLSAKIDMAVFPGLQGGPHLNQIAGLAVALEEATTDAFKDYGKQVVVNATALASALQEKNMLLVGGGTQNHLMILDFTKDSVGKGTLIARALSAAGIVTNRNTVPGDPSPFYPSGVRIGTPAVTTRGMKEAEMDLIANWIAKVVMHCSDKQLPVDKTQRAAYLSDFSNEALHDPFLLSLASEVEAVTKRFPLP